MKRMNAIVQVVITIIIKTTNTDKKKEYRMCTYGNKH